MQRELQLPTQFLSLEKQQSHSTAVTGTVLFWFMSPSCSALLLSRQLPVQLHESHSCKKRKGKHCQRGSASQQYLQGKSWPADKYQGHWVTLRRTQGNLQNIGGREKGSIKLGGANWLALISEESRWGRRKRFPSLPDSKINKRLREEEAAT